MFEVKTYSYDELPAELKEQVSYWGDKEYTTFLVVKHNDKVLCLEGDRMEPEDVRFFRDLSWVPIAIKDAYECGREDERTEQAQDTESI